MCPSNEESERGAPSTSPPPAATPTGPPLRLASGSDEDGSDEDGSDEDDLRGGEGRAGDEAHRPSSHGPTSRTIAPVSVSAPGAGEAEESAPSRPAAPATASQTTRAASSAEGDKRVDDRAAISLRVDYKRLNTFFADYTKNISKGGTFIRTAKPLDIGTEFIFVLSVPSHNKQLELKGEVVWIVTEEAATRENPAGMGIKFKFVDDSERSAVDDFVEKLMDEALGHHISTKLLRRS